MTPKGVANQGRGYTYGVAGRRGGLKSERNGHSAYREKTQRSSSEKERKIKAKAGAGERRTHLRRTRGKLD